jgi:hypothetical protein
MTSIRDSMDTELCQRGETSNKFMRLCNHIYYIMSIPKQVCPGTNNLLHASFMAETVFSAGTGTNKPVASTSLDASRASRHSRIHFPLNDELSSSRSGHSAAEHSQKSSSVGFKPSPVRQGSSLRPNSVKDSTSGRPGKRLRSAQATNVFPEMPRPNRVTAIGLTNPGQRVIPKQNRDPGSEEDDFGPQVFSDEYDLCKQFLLHWRDISSSTLCIKNSS